MTTTTGTTTRRSSRPAKSCLIELPLEIREHIHDCTGDCVPLFTLKWTRQRDILQFMLNPVASTSEAQKDKIIAILLERWPSAAPFRIDTVAEAAKNRWVRTGDATAVTDEQFMELADETTRAFVEAEGFSIRARRYCHATITLTTHSLVFDIGVYERPGRGLLCVDRELWKRRRVR